MKKTIFKTVVLLFLVSTGYKVYNVQFSEKSMSKMALRNVEALSNNEYGICAEWIIKNCYEEFTEMHGADYYATCSETTMGGMGECAAVESKIPKSDASQCLHCIRYY